MNFFSLRCPFSDIKVMESNHINQYDKLPLSVCNAYNSYSIRIDQTALFLNVLEFIYIGLYI